MLSQHVEVAIAISRIVFAVLILVLCSSSLTAQPVQPVNLLRNPSFEEIGTWNTSTADANDIADPRNSNNSHTGNHSAYTKATTIGGDGYAILSQEVSIPISPNLEFSFWLYVKHPELQFHGYIKGFVATSSGRFFDVGIWSDLPQPHPNEYLLRTQLERYDTWIKVRANIGRLWIDEAKFPRNDTITAVSLGIYNGLVYALPKNLLQLEVFFDDVFLGPSTLEDEPRFPWFLTASILISIGMVTVAFLERRRRSHLSSKGERESIPGKMFLRWLKKPEGDCHTFVMRLALTHSPVEGLSNHLSREESAANGLGWRGLPCRKT